MALTKEKAKKNTAEEDSAMVLEYLRQQNRPYSATDVSANLHNKVSKTNAAKLLKDLHDRKEIAGRAAGKQLVYHSLQPTPSSTTTEATSDTDLTALDTQASTLRATLTSLKSTEKSLKTELATLSALPSPDDLKATVTALNAQKAGLKERLAELKALNASNVENATPVSEAEKAQLDNEREKWGRWRGERSRVLKGLWGHYVDVKMRVAEEVGTRVKEAELWEESGCEGSMPM